MKEKSITASEFDERFDNDEDIMEFLEIDSITKPSNQPKHQLTNK